MGQKIHPLGFRLGITQKHRSEWFAKKDNYSKLLIEDHFLRKTVFDQFSDAGIISIEIKRKLNQIKLNICTARPRLLVGKNKAGLKVLRTDLTTKLQKYRKKNQNLFFENIDSETNSLQIAIQVTKLLRRNTQAPFIADFLVEQLEKRVPFRRAVKQGIEKAELAGVKGIKIQVSGRLNGAEIARSEWVRKGRVPLQTLRADIDYGYRIAKTIYGLLGIKVWIFNG